jgi:uncharacterized cupin superfamily protein
MKKVNLFGAEWDSERDRAGWQWKRLSVGQRLGAEQIGAGLYELAPGQKTFPYHLHYNREEWLIVLAGEPTLRSPDGERRLAEGDCVAFARGPSGAHLVRNDSDAPARFLILSSQPQADVVAYPDSGKIGAMAVVSGEEDPFRLIVREDSAVDYFEGED